MSLSTSPVLAAAASNDLSQIRWLIERENVPVDFMGDWYAEPRNGGKGLERQKRTPCMVAASHGALEVLLYVLQMGADPNKRSEDEERCTAMHCAAAGGAALSTEAIKTLLLFGADRNARDMYGRVPADCLPGTASDMNANGSSDAGGSSSGGSASTGGNRGHTPSSQAVNSQAALQDPDEETLMSDEFRMYEFKIRRCSRTRAHDWTECPYTHPGEKLAGEIRGDSTTVVRRVPSSARGRVRRVTCASTHTVFSSVGFIHRAIAPSCVRTAPRAIVGHAFLHTTLRSCVCRRMRLEIPSEMSRQTHPHPREVVLLRVRPDNRALLSIGRTEAVRARALKIVSALP